jgi:hypothetical protein
MGTNENLPSTLQSVKTSSSKSLGAPNKKQKLIFDQTTPHHYEENQQHWANTEEEMTRQLQWDKVKKFFLMASEAVGSLQPKTSERVTALGSGFDLHQDLEGDAKQLWRAFRLELISLSTKLKRIAEFRYKKSP